MEEILIGTTDRTITIFIPDPASTVGKGKTGLVAATLTVSYVRVETDNDVTVTDVTSSLNDLSALTDAHNDWGVKEISSTLAPGLYRLDVADAVFATGAWYGVVFAAITSGLASNTPKAFLLVANTPSSGVTVATGGIGSGAHAAAELNAIADAVLDRNMATGTDSGTNSTTTRTVRQALRPLRNKVTDSAGTVTVTKEDDSTTSWTATSTRAAVDTLTAIDPT